MNRILADLVFLAHLGYIAFAVAGGFLVLRWRRVAWVHVPAVLWAVFVELTGRICPLTPWENLFREAAGRPGYSGGFLDHYLVPLVYPEDLTRGMQRVLGVALLLGNALIYALPPIVRRRRRRRAGARKGGTG